MQRFKEILAMVDERHDHMLLLERAAALAQQNQASLTIVDVLPASTWEDDTLHAISHELSCALADQLATQRTATLEAMVAPIREQGLAVETRLLRGTPFLAITKEVLRNGHDLLMLTPEGATGLRQRLFGSTTMHLMRKCPCPIWAIKSAAPRPYQRILVAVDPSSDRPEQRGLNIKLMDLATSLARHEQSELHIVHAWSLYGESMLRRGRLSMPREQLDRYLCETESAHRSRLDDLLQRYDLATLPHTVHLVKGIASDAIMALVEARQIDLIVMGTVSRTGVAGLLIGNTAENVLQQVNCSVLTVKPDGFVSPVRLIDVQ